jgi:hypothetical protein
MRTITVVYGPVDKSDAMLMHGGDLYVETSPRKWARMVDLPSGHPACLAASQGSLKAANILTSDGTSISCFNALDPEHQALVAKEGLVLGPDGLSSSAKKYSSPTDGQGYNEMMDHIEDVRQQLQQQRRNLPESDKNDLLRQVDEIREKINDLQDGGSRQKLLFMERLNELMDKIQTTKNEEYSARKAYLKMRVARLQENVAKLAEEEDKGIDAGDSADFKKPKDVQAEFIQAVRKLDMTKDSFQVRQLEALFAAHSITDFEDYLGNPENMARLRKLAGLA